MISTISNNHTRRRVKTASRGPVRFRWQPKEPPQYHSAICILLILVTILLLSACIQFQISPWTPAAHSSDSNHLRHHGHRQQHYQELQQDSLLSLLSSFAKTEPIADAIVVGSGLAGLTATLTILDRGGKVILIEKESIWGGNSNKASSGMNACCSSSSTTTNSDHHDNSNNDTIADFFKDTVTSAGDVADLELIHTLVDNSASALSWFRDRVGVDLSVLVQLGGHSKPRTHRPKMGFVGAELINAMETAIRKYQATDRVTILVNTQVSQVLYNNDRQNSNNNNNNGKATTTVLGVVAQTLGEDSPRQLRSDHVILATGGFASDRSSGSYLERYRPELLGMAATAGAFSTGDGITLAESLGAATRDMDKVQIHPTGFVDPSDPTNPNKVLAAELLRGVGGLLLNRTGHRFCDELGTRAYVTDKMLKHSSVYAESKHWDVNQVVPTFFLVLSSSAAEQAKKHVDLYVHKGVMKKVQGLQNLANHLGLSSTSLLSSFRDYASAAADGQDEFGKTGFRGIPPSSSNMLDEETFYVAEVTPVLHYCMGGLKIDKFGNVLSDAEDQVVIHGLHAAGEVTGGVHGNNRLGGNSLLECAVYGTIVGREIPIPDPVLPEPSREKEEEEGLVENATVLEAIAVAELSQHNSQDDLWVAVYGKVYDLSSFASRHPGGKNSIIALAGNDATNAFSSVHSANILTRLAEHQVGILDTTTTNEAPQQSHKTPPSRMITSEELGKHNTAEDCWVSLHGTVYDLTEFSKTHPGGAYVIQKLAGTDATMNYHVFHKQDKLVAMQYAAVGTLVEDSAGTTNS